MKRLIVPTFALLSFALADCGASPADLRDPTCSTTTFNVEGSTFTTFGTSADARKIDAFLRATLDLNDAVIAIHDGLTTTCAAIGTDLGIAASEYTPSTAGELPVTYTCRRVATEITNILHSLPANAHLTIDATPPRCEIDLNIAAQCTAACTGSASATVPTCQGTVVAECTGSCDGSCTGTCSGGCTGLCRGTCGGQCMGTCSGECSGSCSQMDSAGRCIGTCAGTCNGSCSATCTGSCSGTCEAGCTGSCSGQCRGMCSVASSVRCDGMYSVQADVQCTAACQAQANARAVCSDPQLAITVDGGVSPAGLARLNTLIASLQNHYPRILANTYRIQRVITTTAPAFTSSLNGLGGAATDVGLTASACVVRAVAVAADFTSRFAASTQVTVDISLSVTATGSVQ